MGIKRLKRSGFDHELIKEIHNELLRGNVRKQKGLVGDYRSVQNYIKRVDGEVSYVPPKPEHIQSLMDNLIQYMNNDNNPLRPLVRIAIVHGQFESIHPFEDGNGRVGRILIPLYLYSKNQIALPFLFISETLERDKYRYYGLLNNIRDNQTKIEVAQINAMGRIGSYTNDIDEMTPEKKQEFMDQVRQWESKIGLEQDKLQLEREKMQLDERMQNKEIASKEKIEKMKAETARKKQAQTKSK